MPEPDCFLLYRIGYGTLQPSLGCQRAALLRGILRLENPTYTLQRAVVLKWFYALSRWKTFVEGKCALPNALLVIMRYTAAAATAAKIQCGIQTIIQYYVLGLSIRLSDRPLVFTRLSIGYFVNELLTEFDANWHKSSTQNGYETVSFGVKRLKVTQGRIGQKNHCRRDFSRTIQKMSTKPGRRKCPLCRNSSDAKGQRPCVTLTITVICSIFELFDDDENCYRNLLSAL